MILYLFAFLSGVVMIFAPCIWPLLPIILSSGIGEGRRKPLGIVVGLSVSFLFATLLLFSLLNVVPIRPEVFQTLGIIILLFFGFTLLIPKLLLKVEGAVSKLSARLSFLTPVRGEGFGRGIITGGALGIVWSPCAGPILATVAAVAATQGVSLQVFFLTLAFILGVSVPLFLIALFGQRIFARMRKVNKYTPRIQQFFGFLVIITALILYTGYDQTLQARILAACGLDEGFFSSFEKNHEVMERLESLRMGK